MVTKRKQHSSRRPVKQGRVARAPRPNKIRASTPYHFRGKNLTPYGGLLPVATLLEKLGFQALLEETITTKRITRAMSPYQFVLALVLGLYVGFARLNQLRFIARDPILTGILQVTRLPPQSTLWRFLASLHLNVAKQILSIQRQLRERVWAAAQVKLETVTLDTDTTVHTLYGRQMGGRKSYNPKNKGKRSYQPILTFLAETREYLMAGLRGGDRPTGQQIAAHLESAFRALPGGVKRILARADAGFYCWEAVAAYQQAHCQFSSSSSWRARPGGWSSSCSKRPGSPRPTPTRRRNANSSTSRKAGRRPAVSWRCVTKRSPRPARPSNTSCLQPALTPTACLSPT